MDKKTMMEEKEFWKRSLISSKKSNDLEIVSVSESSPEVKVSTHPDSRPESR